MFSFEFAALSYVDPQRNQYRFMLEPLDHSWNQVDAQRRLATFTTLPAGTYTVRVLLDKNRNGLEDAGDLTGTRTVRFDGSALYSQDLKLEPVL